VAKLILFTGYIGFALLFAVTIVLVLLNRSEKVLAPVLSILLVGTAATLAAVLAILKESKKEASFVTSVVLDTVAGAPAFITSDQGDPKLTQRFSDLFLLGRPAVRRNGDAIITIAKPNTEDESFTYCQELLQYHVFHTIEKLQRGGWRVVQTGRNVKATVSVPMKLSRVEDYPGRKFLPIVASNRFSNSDGERIWWEHGHFPLPKNATVSLIHQSSSPSTGTEKHVIRFEKPLFFQIDFAIEPLGATGEGVLPEGLHVNVETTAHWRTYPFQVTLRATFDKITACNWQTEEYKSWADWLFSGLRESLAD